MSSPHASWRGASEASGHDLCLRDRGLEGGGAGFSALPPPHGRDGKRMGSSGRHLRTRNGPSPMDRLDTRPKYTFPDLPSFARYAVGSQLLFASAILVPSYNPTASREPLLLKATPDVTSIERPWS